LPYAGPMYSLIPASITDLDTQIDWFIKQFSMIFDTSGGGYFGDVKDLGAGNFGPGGDEDLHVCSVAFKKQLLSTVNERCKNGSNCKLSRKEFFILVHIAYGLCVRSFDVRKIRYIFFHTHMHVHDEWQAMLEDFPELYFIGMTRDPRQDWVSWKKIYAWRMQRDPARDVPRIFLFLHEINYSNACHALCNLVDKLGEGHVRIIDLEKLHILNHVAMTDLCCWLNIEFNECLLQSTFNGRQWHGNATNGKKTSALNPKITRDEWRNVLPDHDRQDISLLLPGSIKYFEYDKEIPAVEMYSENITPNFKYRSDFLLLIHCIVFRSCLWGNPAGRFWQCDKIIDKVRIMRCLCAILFEGARLFLELRGDGLDRKLVEVAAQQRELLRKTLPPTAIVQLY
jgi:hypothetical protein